MIRALIIVMTVQPSPKKDARIKKKTDRQYLWLSTNCTKPSILPPLDDCWPFNLFFLLLKDVNSESRLLLLQLKAPLVFIRVRAFQISKREKKDEGSLYVSVTSDMCQFILPSFNLDKNYEHNKKLRRDANKRLLKKGRMTWWKVRWWWRAHTHKHSLISALIAVKVEIFQMFVFIAHTDRVTI